MAIKGSLKEASLPDVVQLLAIGRKTGCLSVADRGSFGYIYFEEGRITYAAIVNRRDRLGDILVKSGRLSHTQLEAVVTEQERSREHRLGELLISRGWISRDELEQYIRLQIEEAVYFLFTWTQGTFHFEPDVRPEHQDFLVSINTEGLLLEGARRVDEWSLIEKKIPSFDLIFTPERERLESREVELTQVQELVLELLDGTRDVAAVIDDSGLGEFDVGKALYGLITAGFVQRQGRRAPSTPEVSDARVEEHRNLGVAFYKTGMLDEAAREFRRVVELRPSDAGAHFHEGLVAIRHSRWQDAVRSFRMALEKGGNRPAILHNLALTLEQLGELEEAEATYAEANSWSRDNPTILTGWGIVALKRGDAAAAAERLDRARRLMHVPPPVWYWARTLAAAASEDFSLAESLAEEAVEKHPQEPVLRNNLAVLLELAGELARAERLIASSLTEAPSLAQLSKNLGDVRYRAGRYDDAWESYQRAIGLAPELGDDVYFKMGNIAYKRGEREHAEQYWRHALLLNPTHELARSNLATLHAVR